MLENFTLSGIATNKNLGIFKIFEIFIVAVFVVYCIEIVSYQP